MSNKVLIALSGGMDSTTVLAKVLADGKEAIAVSFQYGSKHNQYELASAKKVAEYYQVPYLGVLDLSNVGAFLSSDLLKSGGDIPEGHYTDESMIKTVVPGRNIIFLSIMAGVAWTEGADQIAIGIHQGDHAIYPDCRPIFFYTMNAAIAAGTDGRVHIIAPFINTDKTGILSWGISNGVPYHLTRTCYKDQLISCGKCGSCVERKEAFSNHNIRDPISYQNPCQK